MPAPLTAHVSLTDGFAWLAHRGQSLMLTSTGDGLLIHGPQSKRTDAMRAWLRENKAAIIGHLRESALADSLDELAQEAAEADAESQFIEAARNNRLPLARPRLKLPSGRCADDVSVFVCGLAANLRRAVLEDPHEIAIPAIPPEETNEGTEVPATTWGQIVATDAADLAAAHRWWRDKHNG